MSNVEGWQRSVSDVNDGILLGVEGKAHKGYYAALAVSIVCLLIGA